MEVTIKGSKYRAGRLTPHQAFHVMRRLGPTIISSLLLLGKDLDKLPDEQLFGYTKPLIEALGKMPNEDADYVINTCLLVCEKSVADKWAPVWVKTGEARGVPEGRFMMDDIGMNEMLQLVRAAIQENLANFGAGQPAKE